MNKVSPIQSLDDSKPATPMKQTTKENYENVTRIEETIQMTKNAFETIESTSSMPIAVLQRIGATSNAFKQEEKLEIKKTIEKSSSGNSSLLSNGHNVLIELVNDNNFTNHQKFVPCIETVNNELEIIRNRLKENLLVNNRFNSCLEQLYRQDLNHVEEVKKSEFKKASKSVETDNNNLVFSTESETQSRSNLKISERSRAKSVLLPRCKSLVNYSRSSKRDSQSTCNTRSQGD